MRNIILYKLLKRSIDVVFGMASVVILMPVIILLAVAIKLTSTGPVLYWSDRVGRKNKIFKMPKFRTMKTNTPAVATHLLQKPEFCLTPIGNVLRKFSLDEIPQLWSVVVGEMTLVGPRPALYNQDDLNNLRTIAEVHLLKPGITGLAQTNGRDTLTIEEKVVHDVKYMNEACLSLDFKILWLTVVKVVRSESVSH